MAFRRVAVIVAGLLVAAGVSVVVTDSLTSSPSSATPTANGTYTPLTPSRVLDTRSGKGAPQAAVAARGTVTLSPLPSGVPASSVSAVVLNVTVTAPTEAGYITVYADGQSRPTTSNLNFTRGQTVPNLVVVPIGSDGKVDLYNGSTGSTQLIADLQGYFQSGGSVTPPGDAGAFGPVSPTRLLDTRIGTGVTSPGAVAGHTHVAFDVVGGNVPSNVSAVLLNVTATDTTAAGYVTAWADGTTQPTASNLNFNAGQTVPNLVTAPVGSNGEVDLYNGSTGSIHLVADVFGYFVSGSSTDQGAFSALTPTRLLDTRVSQGGSVIASKGTLHLQVDNAAAGLPGANVSAVILNVTVATASASGYLTVWGDGAAQPTASNLNFSKGQTVPNLVIAPVGTDGKVAFYNGSGGDVQVIADAAGYVYGNVSTPALSFASPDVIDSPHGGTTSVSCVSSTFCEAVDADGAALTYNGATWTAPVAVDTIAGGLTSVSCTSTTFCAAVSTSGEAMTFNGSSWTSPTQIVTSGGELVGVSCVSSTFCVAVNESGISSTFNGSTWAAQVTADNSPGEVTAISCASTTFCVVVDATGHEATFTGAWQPRVAIDTATSGIFSVSCSSSTFCAAVDLIGNAVRYNGTTWTTDAGINNDQREQMGTVSCTSSTFCMAGDDSGNTLRFNGTTWTNLGNIDALGNFIDSISCVGTTFCIALDTASTQYVYTGTWSAGTNIDPENNLTGVSCPTASFCVAVDAAGSAVIDNAGSWGSPTPVDAADGLNAVSCVSSTFCVAVGDTTAVVYNGSTWTSPATVVTGAALNPNTGQGSSLLSVSCASSTFCVATGANFTNGTSLFSKYTGTWSTAASVSTDTSDLLGSVSCPTATFCTALGESDAVSYNGSTWAAPSALGAFVDVGGVSCPTAAFCVGLDSTSHFSVRTSNWGPVSGTPMPRTTSDSSVSVSCVSATFCLALTAAGEVMTYDGTTWSAPVAADSAARPEFALSTMSSASCATTTFCALVGGFGSVVIGS